MFRRHQLVRATVAATCAAPLFSCRFAIWLAHAHIPTRSRSSGKFIKM
ncbi:hypothetical protein HMPREF3190_01214 [Umbribacter vaginalis]|nr:hypothetical protein HMPREF3190_01214 [Coriobacteriales bacterium DNF00809]